MKLRAAVNLQLAMGHTPTEAMGDTGHEHQTVTPSNHKHLRESEIGGGAESGAVGRESASFAHQEPSCDGPFDPALSRIVAAWPRLPKHIKSAIGTLVKPSESSSELDQEHR